MSNEQVLPVHPNFRDIPVDNLTEEEKNIIRLFRNMHGQHGESYSRNLLIFTDGVATTWLESECEKIVDIFAQAVHWEDDDYINHLRKRHAETQSKVEVINQAVSL
jgi:hypothetical protein